MIDEKGVAGLRCGERVRNYMKTKGMVDPEAAADLTDFADKRAIGGEGGTWGQYGDHGRHFGAQRKKPFKMIAWNYDCVNTQISD